MIAKKLLITMNFALLFFSTIIAANLQTAYTSPPPGGYLDEMKYPNIVKPDFQFGYFEGIANQLIDPAGVAVTGSDNIYVTECGSNSIHVFTKEGKSLTRWGTSGSNPSQFICPEGIAIDTDGKIFVSDTANDRIQVFNADHEFLFQFGKHGFSEGEFLHPIGIAVDSSKIYVADAYNHRIQVFDKEGNFLFSIGKYGDAPGEFNRISDVAVDEEGYIYTADTNNNRIQKFDSSANLVHTWGSRGSYSGQFAEPTNIEYQGGELLIEDLINHRVQAFDKEGNFLYQWGRHPPNAHEGNGRMHYPTSLAVSPSGNFVVVCEQLENRCQAFSLSNIKSVQNVDDSAWWVKGGSKFHYGESPGNTRDCKTTGTLLLITEPDTHFVVAFNASSDDPEFLGSFGGYGKAPGQFISPGGGIATELSDGTCQVLFGDGGNNRLQLVNVTKGEEGERGVFLPSVVRVIDEGMGERGGQFRGPVSPVKDNDGNIYVLDVHNARVQVFDPQMNFLRQWGEFGNQTGQFNTPLNMAIDPSKKIIYVVDTFNFRIQAFDINGNFLFTFGTPGLGGPKFMSPFGITVDKEGFVYVTDVTANSLKKFDPKGNFIKEWGHWGQGEGQFYKPKGVIALENAKGEERIYVIDFGNHRGQIFNTDGKFINFFGPLLSEMTNTMRDNVNPLQKEFFERSENSSVRLHNP